MSKPRCFLAQFSERPCDGLLIRAHLISKQALKRRKHDVWDKRAWVWACGGWTGLEGHHGSLDSFKLVIPRESLPAGLLRLCDELELGWWLDRRYGCLEDDSAIPASRVAFPT